MILEALELMVDSVGGKLVPTPHTRDKFLIDGL